MSRASVDYTATGASTPGPSQNGRARSSPGADARPLLAINNEATHEHSLRKRHEKIVLADPVALMYLEEDPSTTLFHRREILQGYETYIVEQWACSRVQPTFIIATYTGDPAHHIRVGVLGIPTDRDSWSPRLKLYFDAVQQFHAVAKDTPLGVLMVTNLSAFPSALTVIAVPEGDISKNREHFIVNEDLKRLGCAGRSGLKLQPPSPVVQAKFHQLYKTSDRVPLYTAVMELVKLCQLALVIFDKLRPEYADGLLCDVTEKAIGDWWADIGTDLYNIEPSDGILGATTVAALLGALLGARHRLHAAGAPVPKDAFYLSSLKRGIGSFQKSQKLQRTRRLDRDTLDRLHRVSQKAASSERWTGAVKSTVAELSGKGGVMGMVSRERGSISDIETLDLEQFAQLANGERARWLWRGKPRKTAFNYGLENAPPPEDVVFTVADDQGSYVRPGRKRHNGSDSGADRAAQDSDSAAKRSQDYLGTVDDKDSNLGRFVSRSLTEKVSDARAGFGRFKDAVGIPSRRSNQPQYQGHHHHHHHHHHRHRPNKESVNLDTNDVYNIGGGDSEVDRKGSGAATLESVETLHTDNPNECVEENGKPTPPKLVPPEIHIEPVSPPSEAADNGENLPGLGKAAVLDDEEEGQEGDYKDLELSKTRSTEAMSEREAEACGEAAFRCLRRSQSLEEGHGNRFAKRHGQFTRHLSFSTVEEVILVWKGFKTESEREPNASLDDAILHENILLSDAQIFRSRVLGLTQQTVPWVEGQVTSVEILYQKASALQEELEYIYPEHIEAIQEFRERINQLFGNDGSRVTEETKKVELLGAKLDYELNVLESRIEDVEAGLQGFQRNVDAVEKRIQRFVQGEQRNDTSWFSWAGRKFWHF